MPERIEIAKPSTYVSTLLDGQFALWPIANKNEQTWA